MPAWCERRGEGRRSDREAVAGVRMSLRSGAPGGYCAGAASCGWWQRQLEEGARPAHRS